MRHHYYLSIVFLLSCVFTLKAGIDQHRPSNVTQIEARTTDGVRTTLGSTFDLNVTTTEIHKGKTYHLQTPKVPWDEFSVEVQGGTFSKGKITAASTLSATQAGKLMVHVVYLINPKLDTVITIDLVHGKELHVGGIGLDGENGAGGMNGSAGARNQGGGCWDGDGGGDGIDAGSGENGPDIDVYIKRKWMSALNEEMICVLVVNHSWSDTACYFIDAASKINVYSFGGDGGTGGNGGDGGKGGVGDNGTTCPGGPGGNGGDGGHGGNGGRIIVHVDEAISLSDLEITMQSYGGEAGNYGVGGTGGDSGGSRGQSGSYGYSGSSGPKPVILTEKLDDSLFL